MAAATIGGKRIQGFIYTFAYLLPLVVVIFCVFLVLYVYIRMLWVAVITVFWVLEIISVVILISFNNDLLLASKWLRWRLEQVLLANTQDFVNFIMTVPRIKLIVSVFIVIFLFYMIVLGYKLKVKISKGFKIKLFIITSISFVYFAGVTLKTKPAWRKKVLITSPVLPNILPTLFRIYEGKVHVEERSEYIMHVLKDSVKVCKNPFDKIVLIIGESTNRDYMETYGYPAKNTPFLDTLSGKVKLKGISSGDCTGVALRTELTSLKVGERDISKAKSILTLAKLCGYRIYWLSNQEPPCKYTFLHSIIDESDTFITLFKKSDIIKRLYGTVERDEALLPIFRDLLNESKDRKVLFVIHLYNTHYLYKNRYSSVFERFGQTRVGTYLNAILYLDYFLSEINNILKNAGVHFMVIYFSDHGELPNSTGFSTHALPVPLKNEYKIPILIWSNTRWNRMERLDQYKDSLINGESIYNIFAYLIGYEDSLKISTSPFVASISPFHIVNFTRLDSVPNAMLHFKDKENGKLHQSRQAK